MKKPRYWLLIIIFIYSIFSVICIFKAYTLYNVVPSGDGMWYIVNSIGCKIAFIFNFVLYIILAIQSCRHLFGQTGWGWGIGWSFFVFGPLKLLAIIPVVCYWILHIFRRRK